MRRRPLPLPLLFVFFAPFSRPIRYYTALPISPLTAIVRGTTGVQASTVAFILFHLFFPAGIQIEFTFEKIFLSCVQFLLLIFLIYEVRISEGVIDHRHLGRPEKHKRVKRTE